MTDPVGRASPMAVAAEAVAAEAVIELLPTQEILRFLNRGQYSVDALTTVQVDSDFILTTAVGYSGAGFLVASSFRG